MQIRYHAICNGFWSGFNMKIEPRHDKTIKMICAPSEDSDQPGHPPSLIRVSAVRLKRNWVLSYPLSAQRRLWSDWVDAQAHLSLHSVCLKRNWVLIYTLSAQRRLIRLGGCPGWSESSLGTKVILLVLSWGGSKCVFLESTYAAHIHFITFFTFPIEPNMKSFSHANNIVLRRDICMHNLKLMLNWSNFSFLQTEHGVQLQCRRLTL